jgi:glycosyltransferase involved in cell wall biosynthesis
MKNKKIVFIVNDVSFFLSHRLVIAKKATLLNYKVYLLSKNTDREKIKELKINQINYIKIPISRSSKNILLEIYLFFSIFYNLLKIRPNITHLVTVKPIIYAGIVSRILNFNVIFAVTGLNYIDYIFNENKNSLNKFLIFLFKSVYNFIFKNKHSKIIIQNKDDYSYFINNYRINKENIYLIKGSGVDLIKFKFIDIPSGIPKIIFPARMLADKGFYEFIKAAKIVNKKKILAEFLLAGSHDPENPESIPISYLNKINNNYGVYWMGFVKNINELFNESTIIVLPSYKEGLPKSLQEAAAAGRPIITTNTNGCREVVDDKVNGYLVPVKDHKILADKITFLLKNRKILLNMCKKSRIKAEKQFDQNIIVSQHIEIYKKYEK